jgi:hypothetical protein
MWAGATWMSLLATAGVGAVLGYGLAITRVSRSQWTPIPSPFLSIAGEADDTDEYEDAKMILVVRQVQPTPLATLPFCLVLVDATCEGGVGSGLFVSL